MTVESASICKYKTRQTLKYPLIRRPVAMRSQSEYTTDRGADAAQSGESVTFDIHCLYFGAKKLFKCPNARSLTFASITCAIIHAALICYIGCEAAELSVDTRCGGAANREIEHP